jgi:hypothetical protein
MTRPKRAHLIFLLVWPLFATGLALILRANYPISQILFWGLPALALTVWAREHAKKAALFTIVLTTLAIALNLIFYVTGQWYVVSGFDFRLFGIMAWEDIPYFFLFIYFPILFWEYFFERQKQERPWRKRMTYFAVIVGLIFLAIVSAWAWAPHLLQIPYFYLICMFLVAIIPLALELGEHPRLAPKFLSVGVFFAYIAILYEVTSIYLGQWYYPSTQFIGWVEIFDQRFPLEEFITWILLGAPAVLAHYEYFDDDNR